MLSTIILVVRSAVVLVLEDMDGLGLAKTVLFTSPGTCPRYSRKCNIPARLWNAEYSQKTRIVGLYLEEEKVSYFKAVSIQYV